ncbi:type II toxin-antitoxin system RelE/ParE family toxin [Gardnerella pickettii]|uniref:Addiction module toxin RelE n=1 Tax=Gardnerella vaginalis TaxID=2702 RepID=A0A2I1P711_GARVA|nr:MULTISPECIES: type II toxin-antitoxin system RelE/ParE family toxin [Gardnerella]MDK6472106.1 type II toxin-antitoxin system RelE/ParE family toxin [Bifidobacterium sp. UMB9259]MDK7189475.1 type II toxin-antitoxin system RelE/ParE family toxin [Bifidobacterium sp. UMB1230]PMC45446.1 type II toxin-antitoxin system RelE/ParE family toxin [Peptoniphilus lacrimalis]RIY19001.1 type II toxin-antitoxin system RelE/ParE family toxin [Bifidobacteriaceae bacterium NR026]CRH76363.1 Plasmid stabilisati
MSSFDILVTQDAENDLKNIRDYIASNISKKTSARIINIIKFNIERLSLFPQFAPVVKYEPWNSLGVRRIVVKNFLIYYRVDLEKNTVYILKVTYGKCNQQTVLEQIDLLD